MMLKVRRAFSRLNVASKHGPQRPVNHPQRSVFSAAFFPIATLFAVILLALPPSKAEAVAATTAAATDAGMVGQQLAHSRVSGRLGPWRRAEVVLTQSSEIDDAPFSGLVVTRDPAGNEVRTALPLPDEPESLFMMKVRSVIFRNVDQSPDNELIVLYSAAKIGAQQRPYYASCVYKWQNEGAGRFVRLPAVEKILEGARDSKAVTKYLRSAAKRGTP